MALSGSCRDGRWRSDKCTAACSADSRILTLWCCAKCGAMARIMFTAFSSSGSETSTYWKRRVSAASGSMNCLYSDQVVAATMRSAPLASIGFNRLTASPVPACPPAPTSVCASSQNKITGTAECAMASISAFRRDSNSPRMLAPACMRPRSKDSSRAPCSSGGTCPWAILQASASATAVLPTPALPTKIGLFCRRRSKMSITWRSSASRPITGSISPSRA